MEYAAVNETELLIEANRLVAGGLRDAAIDLLQEGLETSPHSPALLSALGRAYLLTGQPEQAVVYLKRSLEVEQATNVAPQALLSAQTDDFTDDDLAFIDAQAEQQTELDFPSQDIVSAETSPVGRVSTSQPPRRPILHIEPREEGCKAERRDQNEIKARDRSRRLEPQDDSSSPAREINTQHPEESRPPPDTEPTDYDPEFEPADQPPSELPFNTPELVLDFDETESYEEDVGFLVESLGPILDEETGELAWDDYEGLDEFDEEAQRETPDQSQAEDSVARVTRARQIAAELLLECDWLPSTIDLLQQIFVENGWGAARIAIEREIEKGLLPDELVLAMDIRRYWSENERLWTTYDRIRTNAPFMEAEAAYRHMSWAEALRIVRCFPTLPAVEEVIDLIENTYEWWYTDGNLRRSFKTFLKFLKYRTGSMRGALPGHCFFDFIDGPDSELGAESFDFLHSTTPGYQYLNELGIQLPLGGEHLPRNIMSIRKEPER